MGNRVEGKRKSEGLVFSYVMCSVKMVKDLEVEGLEFCDDSDGRGGSSSDDDKGIGENKVENGVI